MLIKTPTDWVIKPGLMMALIVLSDILIRRFVFGADYPLWKSAVAAIGISLPFIIFAFVVLTYMAKLQGKLTSLALTDMLTGLPNRRAFMDQTREAFLRSHSGYLLILDADHFKRINDQYGHAVGDLCLQAIGAHIRAMLDQNDPVGRIGGEEFGVYLQHRSRAALSALGRRLVGPIAVKIAPDQDDLEMTLSVGATDIHHLEPVEAALARADQALYHAKDAGRARMIMEYRARATRLRPASVQPTQEPPANGSPTPDQMQARRHRGDGALTDTELWTGADPPQPVTPTERTPLSAAGSRIR